jgi:hypothetical protein
MFSRPELAVLVNVSMLRLHDPPWRVRSAARRQQKWSRWSHCTDDGLRLDRIILRQTHSFPFDPDHAPRS